ncbi:Uncharacterized protein DBV15_10108 [Temnothorax longispinosus]|uniref:Uncharacterized protein n=1 Tax=Temnothorax longispinosus TaxID=300112 RepID=A0A4S2JDM7_9HYME|nr:Uncharacterized protein DBV15_10108 [Temnothorax longispinosus]
MNSHELASLGDLPRFPALESIALLPVGRTSGTVTTRSHCSQRAGGYLRIGPGCRSYSKGSRGAQLTMKYVHRKSGVLYRTQWWPGWLRSATFVTPRL